jgi:hypothetical protein
MRRRARLTARLMPRAARIRSNFFLFFDTIFNKSLRE